MPRHSFAGGAKPLVFEPNRGQLGQAEPDVAFFARARGYSVSLTPSGVTLRTPGPASSEVRLSLSGTRSSFGLAGLDELESRSHYFLGSDPELWVTDVPHFGRVVASGVIPGVDVVYRSNEGHLEFDLIVHPGASIESVELLFDGAKSVSLDQAGEVRIETQDGFLRMHHPVVYQSVHGRNRALAASYEVSEQGGVRVRVEGHDPSQVLTIDPVLSYSTLLGGSGDDSGRAIAVDTAGSVYLAGGTDSLDFPGGGPLVGSSAYLAKLDASGKMLEHVVYVGGSSDDVGRGVVVDAAGNAYLSGETSSSDFPAVNALQGQLGGDADAFVVKISSTGGAIEYATYLGGSAFDSARGIAVDDSGSVFLMGQTLSSDFPTRQALQNEHAGANDAFVAQIDASGGALVFSTYLGGSGNDLPFHIVPGDPGDSPGWDVDVDSSGYVYVVGTTESFDFPTVNALQTTHGGGLRDAFVSKIAPGGASLVYSTYLGRGGGDSARGVAADDFGNAYVTGGTRSADFPISPGAAQSVKSVLYDAFVLKLDPDGNLAYSTFIGGNGSDGGNAIAIDATGNAYVAGHTASTDFPLEAPVQSTYGGGVFDHFVSKVNASGSELVYSTYLGGSDVDTPDNWNLGLAVDSIGSVYVGASTASTDYPVTPMAAVQSVHAGGFDAVVSKLRTQPELALSLSNDGGSHQIELRLRNPGSAARRVELKFWGQTPALGPAPFSFVVQPLIFELGPTEWITIVDTTLPAILEFPGTRIGAVLLDPDNGATWSVNTCDASPCN